MNKSMLIVLGICAALFLMNPDRDDFESYMENQIEKDMEFESKAGEVFGELLGGGLAGLLASQTEIKNYLLFSTFRLDDDDLYLGMAANFFKL